jgi:hypothetical protein
MSYLSKVRGGIFREYLLRRKGYYSPTRRLIQVGINGETSSFTFGTSRLGIRIKNWSLDLLAALRVDSMLYLFNRIERKMSTSSRVKN